MSIAIISAHTPQKEEDDADKRLSEEAERYFDELQFQEDQDEPMTGQPEVTATPSNVTYEVENEPEAIPTAIRVPAVVSAT